MRKEISTTFVRGLIVGYLMLLACFTSNARAEGWETLDVQNLITRSRYIGVGKLEIDGRYDDGRLKGTLTFSQRLYSGIGDVKSYKVRIAPRTVPGSMQNWPHGKHGLWFILKSGDAYEPVNHPACWMDESEARSVANQIYQIAGKAYEEAKNAAKQQSGSESSGQNGDSSDGEASVAAYGAMAAAADTMRHVPFQDKQKQSQTFYEQVMSMLKTAGIKPPIGGNLASPAGQNKFFEQVRQLLGPAGAAMGELPAQGDPARGTQLASAQNNIGSLYLEFIRNTMGAKNPADALKKMGPIPLDLPGAEAGPSPASSGPPGFPPPPPGPSEQAPAQKPEFQVPQGLLNEVPSNGSRRQMLNSMVGHNPGGAPPGPAMRGPGGPPVGPRPGPR